MRKKKSHPTSRAHYLFLSILLLLISGQCIAILVPPSPPAPGQAPPAGNHVSSPTISLEDTVLVLKEQHSEGKVTLWLRVDNLPPNSPLMRMSPEINDHSAQANDVIVTLNRIVTGKTTYDYDEWQFEPVISSLPI